MEVIKRLDSNGRTLSLFVRVDFDPAEIDRLHQLGLLNTRIMTRDGPLVGRDHLSRNMKSAYRSQLGRVKNRWSPALVRTSGFVLVDTLSAFAGLIGDMVRGLVSLVAGRRKSLAALTRGITIRSRRIETIKEAEMFILLSLAAIVRALDYADGQGTDAVLSGPDLFAQLDGLDFAGAGTELESEFDAVTDLHAGWSTVQGQLA